MVQATIDKKANTLTIVLPLCAPGTRSGSGKTELVATTRGNQVVEIDKKQVAIGVNAYIK
jgi:hypothetical protein